MTNEPNHLPPLPWEISKHATPDYAPQYGIHSGGNDFAIIKGEHAEATAAFIVGARDLIDTLARMKLDGEPNHPEEIEDGAPSEFDMEGDDSIAALSDAIEAARMLLAKAGV